MKTENISGYTCSSRASTLSSQLRDVVGQTEDEESSSGYDSLDGVNSLSNPTYSGHSIHSRYAAALNSSDTKYNSEVRVRPELSLSLFVFFLFFSFSEKLLRRESKM